jgi:ferritin
MRIQHQEELMHAGRLFDYLIQRDGHVELTAVGAPPKTWKSTLSACEAAYKAEVNNTKQINALMDQAIKENDHATRVILEWFVEEQVEEESSSLNLTKQVELAGSSAPAILLLDRELGGRTAEPAEK